MAKRSLGKMSKRSRLLRKRISERRLGIPRLVKTFELGQAVCIDLKSGHFSGMTHPRYRGKRGVVVGKRGKAYVVEIHDYKATKRLIIPAVHLELA
jgi:large subunit ribosomal protein L21e